MNTTKPEWSKDAVQYLAQAPFFVRSLAKRKIEKAAREQGLARITRDFVETIRKQTSKTRE